MPIVTQAIENGIHSIIVIVVDLLIIIMVTQVTVHNDENSQMVIAFNAGYNSVDRRYFRFILQEDG